MSWSSAPGSAAWPPRGACSRPDCTSSCWNASTASAGPQSLAELAAGFYVPNAIVSGTVTAKRFIETDPAGFLVVDALSRYTLSVDVFKKNVPYNLVASAGYQLRSKYYEASDKTDALGSLVLGLKATAQAAPGIKVTGDLSSGFFVFACVPT